MSVAGPSRRALADTPSPPPGKRRKISVAPENVIELSSDDDEPIQKKKAVKRKPAVKRQPPSPPRLSVAQKPGEVFELSDSEDDLNSPNPEIKLRKQLKDMTAKFNSAHADRTRYHNELIPLRHLAKATESKLKKTEIELRKTETELKVVKSKPVPTPGGLADKLEEATNCEICVDKMWVPYLLPECGHTFCAGCLKDWFQSTLTQYTNTHPHYDPLHPPQPPAYLDTYIRQAHNNPAVAAQVAQMLLPFQGPTYTCPTCREAVKTKPSEDYTLKEIVHAAAAEQGIQEPKRVAPPVPMFGRRTGAATAAAAARAPFDTFFPKKRT